MSKVNETGHRRVIILGSGPAGLTAAIYAGRANLKPMLLAGNEPGGQLTLTTDVENYPGYPEGVQGPEMMEQFRSQAERFETEFVNGHVVEVEIGQRPFVLHLEDGNQFTCDSLIIATGTSARWLGLESETKLR